ncbi:alkylated DNA repair protein alkB homolog 8 [Diachasma alloeum]|uniref:alkylated DNA repair protein alkB homolog 8 n=1 Tax=Diachasma alloeum TaxID=454923 RepID=UPI00073821FE|nr:alkylated DNA repair protein alkB homolog 8 [Diachasma alloeum]XP_028982558.1 alkylated DNA repair protein alkB homolog 8 [Diachasma alloeum]
MSERGTVDARKCWRKQKRAQHRLSRDMGINCCDTPTQNLVICNAGLVTGFTRQNLEDILRNSCDLVKNYEILMPPGKSYCFVQFPSPEIASRVYGRVNGQVIDGQESPLYLTFSESLPKLEDNSMSPDFPPGLRIIEDFITPEQEIFLLENVHWNEKDSSSELKHRKVKHFGFEFRYDTNRVDPDDPITPIPEVFRFLQKLFKEHHCGEFVYDQLTINRYLPGQGIPPHIDTHSVFEDPILSLSLGSACVMDFKKNEKKIHIPLPPRSLLVMSGESRYAWSHGICPRHSDIVSDDNGITTRQRGTRTSFTFRKVRRGDCQCYFDEYCDTVDKYSKNIDDSVAPGLELSYVHEVYEEISSHFDETRHKQWPNVAKFLESIEPGSFLLDVGCGNGKYLNETPGIFKVGCDRSSGLTGICRKRSFEVFLSDCLQLPFKSNSLDAAISIAVIHHLSTPERRRSAFLEILRVLRPGGRCLIYVWAKEQHRNSKDSTYLRFNPKKNEGSGSRELQKLFQGLALPVHENRTNFSHSDVLVPWKRKGGGEFLRYYHVFEEEEFVELCKGLIESTVERIYYDQGNWCTILKKI